MNELQIFNNPEFGEIRTLEEDGEILFCGADVAKMLGYVKPSKALSDHCRCPLKRGVPHPQNPEKTLEMIFIKEPDLYRLAFRSTLPGAERLLDWVVEDILPSIRQRGSYALAQTQVMSPAQLIAAQAQLLVDMEKRMDEMQGQTRALEAKVNTAMKALSRPAEDHWRSDMDKAIKELNADMGWSLPKLRGKLFAELEQTVNCNLNMRVTALRNRMKKTGMRYRDAKELGKLDAIAADKQLRVIFEGIVRSYQAQVVHTGEVTAE